MTLKGSQRLKRVMWIVGSSVGMALLFAIIEMAFEPGQEIVPVIQAATNGAFFGAILGGVHQRFITRWTQGVFIGAILGAVNAFIWWIAAETGLSEPSRLSPLLSMLILAAAYAFAGGVFVFFSGKSKAI